MNANAVTKIGRKIFGTQNDRELKSIAPIVGQIKEHEAAIHRLSDDELKAKTPYFKDRLKNGETLDGILPEAFAVVREASIRTLGLRHYDVQMIGGITLHRGRIAEMRTGEGKTLVATLPCYLNALSGKGVHVITVNDYLARRDSEQMGRIHNFLGLRVGVIVHGLNDRERQENYGCDITYGTNNEFGFDYLRDNMKFRLEDYVQRELNFCIVDEVDSILIDEARTPLIISGPTDESTDLYYRIDRQIREGGGLINEVDYTIEEKSKTAALSEAGVEKMEKRLGISNLYDPVHIEILHHVNQALRAHVLFKLDVDYVVKNGEVLIVDEHTGRLMPGRRWSDGLHQAIEAKEGVDIENENQTLATITFQNYFRMYNKLSGMTGTADTEATEFKQIYKLDVTVIPTNMPMIRIDNPDMIFKSEAGKYKTIVEEIKRINEKGQPVLVGTVSVEKSERLATLLSQSGLKHHVLNAKHHEREAEIVAQAGRRGSITIATNMAGRGTDILLGGNADFLAKAEVPPLKADATDEDRRAHDAHHAESKSRWEATCSREREQVRAAGGLFILGTERHESRRIDNQLRGRAGRQGDPGESRFYLSLDDDLMRIFGSVNIGRFMEEDLPIEHRWITKAIENAQKKVEGHNYDIRKHLLEYDDVMNQQRQVVYSWRRDVLGLEKLRPMVFSMVDELARNIGEEFFPRGKLKRAENGQPGLDIVELNTAIRTTFMIDSETREADISPFNNEGLSQLINKQATLAYDLKTEEVGPTVITQLERMVLLTTIDHLWKDHLLAMDHLREGINLNAYGQKDPLIEYKKQGFRFFEMMMNQITGDVVRKIFAVQLSPQAGAMGRRPGFEQALATDDEAFDADFGTLVGFGSPMNEGGPSQSMQYNLSEDGNLIPVGPNAELPDRGLGAPAGASSQEEPARQTSPAPDFLSQMRGPRRMDLRRGPVGDGGGTILDAFGGRSSQGDSVAVVGRNELCPCGSGKKYKKCHGA